LPGDHEIAVPRQRADPEIESISSAIGVLDRVASELGEVDEAVSAHIHETSDALARPNLVRAAVQVRTAINAVAGARRRLQRRLALGPAPSPRSNEKQRRS
jgi:hypothetical protein